MNKVRPRGESPRSANPQERALQGEPSGRAPQNIQDDFLNQLRRDRTPVTILLVSGAKLGGRIKSFDRYSLVLESDGQEQLIFKHAIATVVAGKASGDPASGGAGGTQG